jgi:hypothetical protein
MSAFAHWTIENDQLEASRRDEQRFRVTANPRFVGGVPELLLLGGAALRQTSSDSLRTESLRPQRLPSPR